MSELKYTVLARKYRPKNFDYVVGQDTIVTILRNILKSKKVGNAYLFCGQRGVGKTTLARIFANAINCENISSDGNPCQQCRSCLEYNNVFELDAASNNSVEDIRNIIDQVRYAPTFGKYNVYIIDEVHMLSQAAFNAFLKTLEEPPAYAIFILATTEKNKVLPTIISRCQVLDFKPMTISATVMNLKKILIEEKIKYDDDALFLIAEKSDGAMRDALYFTDSILNFSSEYISTEATCKILNIIDYEIFYDLVNCLITQDIYHLFFKVNEIMSSGCDLMNFVQGLLKFFRLLLLIRNEVTEVLCEVSEEVKGKIRKLGLKIEENKIADCIETINFWSVNFKDQINKKNYLDFLLTKLKKVLYYKNVQEELKHVDISKEGNLEKIKTFNLNSLKQSEVKNFYKKENVKRKISSPDVLLDDLINELHLTQN